jgi:folate-binding protein YgfZ
MLESTNEIINNNNLLSFFESLGAEIEVTNDISIIKKFTSVEQELNTLNYGVGLRDMNTSGIIELKGDDSLNLLHRITTNSLISLKKEEIKKTVFASTKGRILGIADILNFSSHLLLITALQNKLKLIGWINKYIIWDNVKISDASHRFDLFEIIGPQADSFILLTIGESVVNLPSNNFKVVNVEGMLFFVSKFIDVNGNGNYWILAESGKGKQVISFMLANKGPFDFNLIGEDAYNVYKIEHGIPSEMQELNDLYNPHEANLTELIDFNKGCYIGQEVIARLNTYDKVQKKLVGLFFSDEVRCNDNFLLFDDQQNQIGSITSIVYSSRMKKNLALAYVTKRFAVQGTKLIAQNGNKNFDVTVKELPFNNH